MTSVEKLWTFFLVIVAHVIIHEWQVAKSNRVALPWMAHTVLVESHISYKSNCHVCNFRSAWMFSHLMTRVLSIAFYWNILFVLLDHSHLQWRGFLNKQTAHIENIWTNGQLNETINFGQSFVQSILKRGCALTYRDANERLPSSRARKMLFSWNKSLIFGKWMKSC